MMVVGEKVAGLLCGWRGYAAAALVGAGAARYVQGAFYGRELAELHLDRATSDLAVVRDAIQQTNRDLQAMAANARAAAAVGPELTASIDALSKALKNADPCLLIAVLMLTGCGILQTRYVPRVVFPLDSGLAAPCPDIPDPPQDPANYDEWQVWLQDVVLVA
jgi:hypothetical protein